MGEATPARGGGPGQTRQGLEMKILKGVKVKTKGDSGKGATQAEAPN